MCIRDNREVGYLGVEGRGDRAHSVPAEPLDAHLLGYPLHLPGDHHGGYRFVIAEDHPLAGHGNTGKVAALVSAGFCYKEKFSG